MCKHCDNPVDNRCRIYADYVKRFPGIAKSNPKLIDQFTDYEMARIANGGDNIKSPPMLPDRIKARHPMAH